MTTPVIEAINADLSLPTHPYDPEYADPEIPQTDGKPLDSPWHRDEIQLLIESAQSVLGPGDDYFVGGDMCMYYSVEQARKRAFLGPDFFYVKGVERHRPRRYWAAWLENGRFPDVIVELQSPATAKIDRTHKKEIYEKVFNTREYFLYDPDGERLEGWRLSSGENGAYERIAPGPGGRLWSEELQVWFGPTYGVYLETHSVWLRLYHPDGRLVQIASEREAARANAAERQLESSRQEADGLRRKHEAAEAEIARLRELLNATQASEHTEGASP